MISLRLLSSLGVALALAAGCGRASVESICNKLCDCEPCTDSQYKECILSGNGLRQKAESRGCGDLAQDYLDCVEETVVCFEGTLYREHSEKECNPLEEALEDCD
jgi:hypothetical protein